jgi:hypothetical protein
MSVDRHDGSSVRVFRVNGIPFRPTNNKQQLYQEATTAERTKAGEN